MTARRRTRLLAPTALALLAASGAACGGDEGDDGGAVGDAIAAEVAEAFEGGAGGAGDIDVDVDLDERGEGTVQVTAEDGTASFSVDGDLPEGFPDDVPVPDGATVVTSSTLGSGDDVVHSVTFEVAGPQVAVAEEVAAAFEEAGWSEVSRSSFDTDGGTLVQVGLEKGEDRQAAVSAQPDPESDGSLLSYVISSTS